MQRPNILLLFPDQHRGDWMPYSKEIMEKMGLDEIPLRMPNIKRIMEEGVVFLRAVTPSPLCAPARACLASGLRYDRCNVVDNGQDYPVEQRTFYSVLKEAGYSVGGVGKFDLHKKTHWWGLDGWVDDLGRMGFTHGIDNEGKMDAINSGAEDPKGPYMKYLHDTGYIKIHLEDMYNRRQNKYNSESTQLPDEAYCDNWLSQNGIKMLQQFPKDKPWFMQVNFTGPHAPWDVTKSMKERWKDVDFPLPNSMDSMSYDVINGIRQNYAAMLENIDRNIGLIIDEIEKRGELDRTIIIYSSDHGEMLGDFNRFGKVLPHRGSVHIPLVISGPGIKRGFITDQLVELQDLTATIVELAGCEMPEAKDSISLKPILTDEGVQIQRPYVMSGLKNWRMIFDGRYKVIFTEGQKDRLFDIEEDPWENNDIASEKPEIVDKYKKIMVDECEQ